MKIRLCELLGLEMPIILAPIGTCLLGELAAAVSNEGGLGDIGSLFRPIATVNATSLVGFVLVATFLGSPEIVLDRGLEDDWFGSSFITTVAIVCALAFVLMIPWEMTRRNPTIDIRMVATRQFGACFLVMLATGALLLATTRRRPLGLVRFALRFPHTFYVVAALILFLGITATVEMPTGTTAA